MNKIREYLIHLLGGVTGEEHQQEVSYYFKAARADELRQIKWKMEGCYGQPAEEWCKNIYEYTCKRCEVAFKKFNEYAESINYSKKYLMKEIEAWVARDEDGELYLYRDKPFRGSEQWHENPVSITGLIELRKEWFPEVQWSDEEPTRVTITIKK